MTTVKRTGFRASIPGIGYHQIEAIRRNTEVAAQHRALAGACRIAGDEEAALIHEKNAAALLPAPPLAQAFAQFENEMDDLLGFRVAETKRRLLAALEKMEASAHSPVAGSSAARIASLRRAYEQIVNQETIYVPERVGAKRWHDALRRHQNETRNFLASTLVRESEDLFFASRAFGSAGETYRARAAHTSAVARQAARMEREISRGLKKITRYYNDTLRPVDATGASPRTVLANIELTLAEAGFKPLEIARLVVDNRRTGDGAKARTAHRDRIRTRLAGARRRKAEGSLSSLAAIDAVRRDGSLAEAARVREARRKSRR